MHGASLCAPLDGKPDKAYEEDHHSYPAHSEQRSEHRDHDELSVPQRGLTLEFTRVRKQAKPAVALRVQRRVSPWPDSAFVATLGASMHARTLSEAMVQAQLPTARTVAKHDSRRTARCYFHAPRRALCLACSSVIRAPLLHATGLCISGCGLTFELTRGLQTAKPAVALRVQRRVRRHDSTSLAASNSRSPRSGNEC
jgi:hypothetical protein